MIREDIFIKPSYLIRYYPKKNLNIKIKIKYIKSQREIDKIIKKIGYKSNIRFNSLLCAMYNVKYVPNSSEKNKIKYMLIPEKVIMQSNVFSIIRCIKKNKFR
jgi:hypothetical protein